MSRPIPQELAPVLLPLTPIPVRCCPCHCGDHRPCRWRSVFPCSPETSLFGPHLRGYCFLTAHAVTGACSEPRTLLGSGKMQQRDMGPALWGMKLLSSLFSLCCPDSSSFPPPACAHRGASTPSLPDLFFPQPPPYREHLHVFGHLMVALRVPFNQSLNLIFPAFCLKV